MKKNLKQSLGKMMFALLGGLLIAGCGDSISTEKVVNSNDPAEIALEFYNNLNNSEPDKAKLLALPTTIEFIDQLTEANAFDFPGDTIPFKLMEVSKPELPKEGDTAVVNYKIGDFKNQITLIYTEEKYKVAFTEGLKSVRILNISAIDLYKSFQKNSDQFCKKYGNMRMRVTDLIAGRDDKYQNKIIAIPFDKASSSSPLKKAEWNTERNWEYFLVYFKEAEIAMTGKEESVDHSFDFKFKIVTVDEDLEDKIGEYKNNSSTGNWEEPRQRTTHYSNRISFEGVFRDCDYDEVIFKTCVVTILE